MPVSIPKNVTLGEQTVIRGKNSFNRFFSKLDDALRVGSRCLLENVHFALGEKAGMRIGDDCYLTSPLFLCEERIELGNRVVIGWNAAIMDTDFHPLDPALRLADAVACSPLAAGRARPKVETAAVRIGDDVWIGPQATILKGVTIGDGSFIEPGSLVATNIPANSRVLGNPGRCTPIE